MKRHLINKIISLTLVMLLLVSTNVFASNLSINTVNNDLEKIDINQPKVQSNGNEDLDPKIDLKITININEIRAYDKIDLFSEPDFYVKLYVNDKAYNSPIWKNKNHIKPNWSLTVNVPDTEEIVTIKIQLWDWNYGLDKMCDLSENKEFNKNEQLDIDLTYSLKTAHWIGEDYTNPSETSFDHSGYGRLNGCDDNSIYDKDRDCELWFNITQNDKDNDGIPYWTEVNVYGTDPDVNDMGDDTDGDGVPIEWEHKWGNSFWYDRHDDEYKYYFYYNPFVNENHANMDPDKDGLDNIEEYKTSQWGSDPFRQDIFVELDQMEIGPDGEGAFVPENSKELIREAFGKHNINYQLDDGWMGGGEKTIPFNPVDNDKDLQQYYWDYFLHQDPDNWRRGAFHWGVATYNTTRWWVYAFSSDFNGTKLGDCYYVSTLGHERDPYKPWYYWVLRRGSTDKEYHRTVAYAGVMMHELGHSLGIYRGNTPGCDVKESIFPRGEWLKYRPYRSCMNYNNVYDIVDYSDGSRGKNDFDDWARIDLTLFQTPK